MQQVVRLYKEQVTELSPVPEPGPGEPRFTWGFQLLYDPGFFQHNGEWYDLRQPGHYVLFNPMVNTTRMTVVGGDPLALASSVANHVQYGAGDEGLSLAAKQSKAYLSQLSLRCGPHVDWAKTAFFDPAGFETRQVQFLTMETPNNYADGHIGLEVKVDGSWVLADLSVDSLFKASGGAYLSARDSVTALADDTCVIDPLAPFEFSCEAAPSFGFDATGYSQLFLSTPAKRREWHRRIFQAVGHESGGEVLWLLPPGQASREAWVEGLSASYRVVDETTFNSLFYA